MNAWKSPMAIARKDIGKEKARVARQTALVEQLKKEGRDVTQAEADLEVFTAQLRFVRGEIKYWETQAGLRRQH